MELKNNELQAEIKAFRNIINMTVEGKGFEYITLTDAQSKLMTKGITKLNKAQLVELYEALQALRNEITKMVEEHAQEEVASCPAVATMLKEAFGIKEEKKAPKKRKAKPAPKYGTVAKRKALVSDKLSLAESRIKENEYKIFIGNGNQKLQGIRTFSMPPVETCPSATEMCIMKCYALKDYYRNWDNVSKSQHINYIMSQRADFVELMTKNLMIEAMKHDVENMFAEEKKPLTVRIHVSGDFYSQEYFEKWVQIADNLKDYNIQFGCYTKSINYIKNYLKATGKNIRDININFMFSLWADTKEKFINMADEMDMNIFTAYNKKDGIPEGYMACPDDTNRGACGTTCNMCYEKSDSRKNIAIAIH